MASAVTDDRPELLLHLLDRAQQPVLLVLDQMEDLFTWCADEDVRAFLALLAGP
jgi:hypothetical protein